jgi:hypothetical protein
LRLVATFSTEEARSILIEMARVWSRLADQRDQAPAPVLASESLQPVVQQQQQKQRPPDKSDDTE